MNLHIPQSIQGTSESKILMRVPMHIVTSQRNAPIIGATQDSLTGPYILTNSWCRGDKFYNTMMKKQTFMDLVFITNLGMYEYHDFLTRAKKYYPKYFHNDGSLKNRVCGKLALSAIFPRDFFYKMNTKTNEHFPIVEIREGIIMPRSGPICKKVIGAKQNSVVHKLWLEYNADEAMIFITKLQKFIDSWYTSHQFSMGIADCIVRNDIIAQTLLRVKVCSQKILQSKASEKVKEQCLERILNPLPLVGASLVSKGMNKGQFNSIIIMQKSGAKGDEVSGAQMVALLGQQSINGQRISKVLSGGTRCLYNFAPGDNNPEARGFVYSNFMNGLSATEAFFTAIAGREGVNATAVKISETGYEQKKISRKIEDMKACIDGSVRDCNGNIIHFLFGSDGLDPQKLYNVKGVKYPFFVDPSSIAERINYNCPHKINKRSLTEDEFENLLCNIQSGISCLQTEVNRKSTAEIHRRLRDLIMGNEEIKPVTLYESVIPKFCSLIVEFYETAKVQYGDMLGLKASCAIGEKTTQCTLNVFKVSGIQAKDVTLGLPRLSECLGASSKRVMSTPICTIYLDKNLYHTDNAETAKQISNKYFYDLEETTIKEVLITSELEYNPLLPKKSRQSVIGFVKYKKYMKSNYPWIELYEKLYEPIDVTDWVIILKFNVTKLTAKKIRLREISNRLLKYKPGVKIVISPQEVGQLHVFPDFANESFIKDYQEKKGKDKPSTRVIQEYNFPLYSSRKFIEELSAEIIKGVPGVKDPVARFDRSSDSWIIETEGSNLSGVFSLENIDYTRTMCNHIWRIHETLGIEAARSYLIEELNRILSFDGGYVNMRHIHILVDAMTHTGTITAVRRQGISRESGPIKKLMFEQSLENAIIASTFCEVDPVKSVSSSVMFGVTTKYGTGDVNVSNLSVSVIPRIERVMKLNVKEKNLDIFKTSPSNSLENSFDYSLDYSDSE